DLFNKAAWIYRLISQNRFPSAVKIGSRAIAFVESEVDEWISQRIEERDALVSTKPQL
ncbi:AlpA family phage regulatory protein, partial [Klebsiella pneumoniae]|uniref:helix-turn-helix transcriptional regulator n=1 Tax=Klebsiella pneumoniae TaxID=573 RepID=UPI001231C42D